MGRTLEFKVKFTGGRAEIDQLISGLKGIGGAAGGASGPIDNLNKKQRELSESGNQAEKTIERLEKQLADLSKNGGEPAKKIAALRKELAELGEAKGFDALEKLGEHLREHVITPFGTLSGSVGSLIEGFGPLALGATAVAGGFLLVAHHAFEMVSEFGEAAEKTKNFADRLGISADQAGKLAAAGKIVGVEVTSLEGASRLLSAALEDETGQGKRTADALAKIGVSTKTVSGEQREMGSVVVELLERLSHVESVSERISIAQRTLGRGAKEILPLIENYKELQETVKRMGVEFDEGDEQLLQTSRKIKELSGAFEELQKQFAVKINPIVVPIVLSLTKFVENGQVPAWLKNAFPEITGTVLANKLKDNLSLSDADLRGGTDRQTAGVLAGTRAVSGAEDQRLLNSGADKAKTFAASHAQDLDVMKKRLETLKPDLDKLRSELSSGSIEGDAFGPKLEEFNKLNSQVTNLEASIKAAEKLPEAIKKLAELQKAAGGAAASAGRESADGAAKAIEEFKKTDEELAEVLGPKYYGQLEKLFESQKAGVVTKQLHGLVAENTKNLAEESKKLYEDVTRLTEEDTKRYSETLKKSAEETAKDIKSYDEILKTFADRRKNQLTGAAESQIKTNSATSVNPGDEITLVQSAYQIRLKLAADLFDVEKERIDLILNGEHTRAEGDQAEEDLQKERAKYEEGVDKAREDRENQLLELRKKNLETYRQAAGSVFDAIFSRNAGANLSKLASDFGKNQLKTVFENLTEGTIKKLATTASATGPHLGGTLGNLLKGTAFDGRAASENVPLLANTNSLDQLKISVDTLTSTITGTPTGAGTVVQSSGAGSLNPAGLGIPGLTGGPGAAPGAGSLTSIPGLTTFGSDTTGLVAEDLNPANLSIPGLTGGPGAVPSSGAELGADTFTPLFTAEATAAGKQSVGGFSAFLTGLKSVVPSGKPGDQSGGLFAGTGIYGNDADQPTAQKVGNIAGSVGAVAGGVLGVESGLKQGGARGAATTVQSVLGVAALIPGPQQPFVEGAALLAGVIKGLLPDPRQQRENQITRELQNAKYVAPLPVSETIDTSGRSSDVDFKGNIRTLNATPTLTKYEAPTGFDPLHTNEVTYSQQGYVGYANAAPPPPPVIQATVHVSTIDAQSFLDHSTHIADAVTQAVQQGHRVVSDISKKINPF